MDQEALFCRIAQEAERMSPTGAVEISCGDREGAAAMLLAVRDGAGPFSPAGSFEASYDANDTVMVWKVVPPSPDPAPEPRLEALSESLQLQVLLEAGDHVIVDEESLLPWLWKRGYVLAAVEGKGWLH